MPKFIIVKYPSGPYRAVTTYGKDYTFTSGDSAQASFTARSIHCPIQPFASREEAKPYLEKMIKFNPDVGYDIVEIKDDE